MQAVARALDQQVVRERNDRVGRIEASGHDAADIGTVAVGGRRLRRSPGTVAAAGAGAQQKAGDGQWNEPLELHARIPFR